MIFNAWFDGNFTSLNFKKRKKLNAEPAYVFQRQASDSKRKTIGYFQNYLKKKGFDSVILYPADVNPRNCS